MRKKIKVKIIEESLWDRLPQHVKDEINGIINSKPKEMVEVVHGKWIIDDASIEHCSVCKHRFYISALFAVGGNDEPPCCPNCGAKMDERREDARLDNES